MNDCVINKICGKSRRVVCFFSSDNAPQWEIDEKKTRIICITMACRILPVAFKFGVKRNPTNITSRITNNSESSRASAVQVVRQASNFNSSTNVGNCNNKWPRNKKRLIRVSAAVAATGMGYMLYKTFYSSPVMLAESPSHVKPSRSVINKEDKTGLKLMLYQYQTCPFCCKVRAYLDYLGLSYDIIEVNPVSRKQIKFSNWRKVPIVIVNDGKSEKQLNDSSMIISFLQSYLLDRSKTLDELMTCYPLITYKNEEEKIVKEILNRYAIMYGESSTTERTDNDIHEERKWRKWADNKLVHTLSPNAYRTPGEALQAFNWFSEVGEWEKNFPLWERLMVIYIGAAAMYLIGKRLKKRHMLKDDVRISLYDACNDWTRAVHTKGAFMGGNAPNLADLAVYGVLNAIEGCTVFQDVLENTKIGPWYDHMKEAVQMHTGLKELQQQQ